MPDDAQLALDARTAILRRFERQTLTAEALDTIEGNTGVFRNVADMILIRTMPGREQSLALTALEEAKFWTNQAVALNGSENTND